MVPPTSRATAAAVAPTSAKGAAISGGPKAPQPKETKIAEQDQT